MTTGLPIELQWLLGVAAGRVTPADHLDADTLLALVAHHRLAPHLDAAMVPGAPLPAPLFNGIRAAARTVGLRALARAADLAALIQVLTAAGIDTIAVKGPAVALLLHGDAARRDCCDLDLLVRPEALAAAVAALTGLGFEVDEQPSDFHLQLLHRRRGLVVELHVRLAEEPGLLLLDPWRHTVTLTLAGTAIRTLALPAAVVFAASHGCRHLWSRLGWLTDIAAAARHPAVDWDETFALARDAGVARQLVLALVLAHQLLQAQLPPAADPRLLHHAAPRAAVLLPTFTVPALPEREAIYRLGLLRFLAWNAWQFQGFARCAALARQLRVPASDHGTFPLPRWLEPARPLLRVARIAGRILRRRRAPRTAA